MLPATPATEFRQTSAAPVTRTQLSNLTAHAAACHTSTPIALTAASLATTNVQDVSVRTTGIVLFATTTPCLLPLLLLLAPATQSSTYPRSASAQLVNSSAAHASDL